MVATDSGDYENERFTFRVWLMGLGLIGKDYSHIRKLLCKPLSGNGAWRYGPPKEAAALAATADTEAEEVPGDA